MVRARVRGHLEALKQCFPVLLGSAEIQEFPKTDYAFRIFVPKSIWMQVLEGLADEVDYDNFKLEVSRHQGSAGAGYERALHDVWASMYRLQR